MNRHNNNIALETAIICIIGLGYIGLPLANAFSKSLKVIGYDYDKAKLKKLNENNSCQNLILTDRAEEISKADFIIICVPTPITLAKEPDLSFIESASRTVGKKIRHGSTVILESTVYPGVTEEVVIPILEQESGLKCSRDFKVGYSPERINPGDDQHSIEKTVKVVAGMDEETTELLAALYEKVTPNIYQAKNIRTAEAAKVIENIQRDLNIALMNEFSIIFSKMGLKTKEVLEAAATKWNFQRHSPGLVGGHCIPVDPYYLVHKTKEMGYQPRVILAGRFVNDSMPEYVADMTTRALTGTGKKLIGARVLIMGLTYKENVADTRESPVKYIISKLSETGVQVQGYDPLLDNIAGEFGINHVKDLNEVSGLDVIIITVAHDSFQKITLNELRRISNDKPVLIDIRQIFNQSEAEEQGFTYLTL